MSTKELTPKEYRHHLREWSKGIGDWMPDRAQVWFLEAGLLYADKPREDYLMMCLTDCKVGLMSSILDYCESHGYSDDSPLAEKLEAALEKEDILYKSLREHYRPLIPSKYLDWGDREMDEPLARLVSSGDLGADEQRDAKADESVVREGSKKRNRGR